VTILRTRHRSRRVMTTTTAASGGYGPIERVKMWLNNF
jgi:hypothetical protein